MLTPEIRKNLLKELDEESKKNASKYLSYKMYVKMFLHAMKLDAFGIRAKDIKC